jgi:hypothetical protein
LVRYNPVHYPPLSIISITLASARSEPMKVPASQAMSGFSSGVAAFDGYVFAMKVHPLRVSTHSEIYL